MRGALAVAACVAVGAVLTWGLRRLARRASDAVADPVIDRLIGLHGVNRTHGRRRHFEGFDPALRERAARKRDVADRSRALARRIDATPTDFEKAAVTPFERRGQR